VSDDTVWSDGKWVPINEFLKDRSTGYSKGAGFEILRELYKKAHTVDELINLTNRAKSTVHLVLRENLEKSGLVYRKSLVGSKEQIWSLSPKGVEFVKKLLKTNLAVLVRDTWKAPEVSLENRILRLLRQTGQRDEDYLKKKLKAPQKLLENTLIQLEQKDWLEKSHDKNGKTLWDLSSMGVLFGEPISYMEDKVQKK
jgi:DNA-binding HxlR family transcriptional regulator